MRKGNVLGDQGRLAQDKEEGGKIQCRAPDPLPADPSMREDEPLVEDGGSEDVDDLQRVSAY